MSASTMIEHHGPSLALHSTDRPGFPHGLSADQERETATLIAGGDKAARNRLVLANLGLVVSIARKFQGRGLAFDDLVGEGNLGLIRAAECFDLKFGTRFRTYASYWVEEAIRDALINRTAMIRLPAYMIGLLTKWDCARQSLHQQWGYPPSFEEVAAHLNLTEREKRLLQRAQRTLRRKADSYSEVDEVDFPACEPVDSGPAPDDEIQSEEDRNELVSRMRCLDERELRVIESRFGFGGESPLTLRQIAEDMGLTREWISRIEKRAIKKLSSIRRAGAKVVSESQASA